MDLKGKTALVTGAATRLGRSIALALAAKGARVVVHYRNSEEEALQTLADVNRLGSVGCLVQGDLSRREDIERIAVHAMQYAHTGGATDGHASGSSASPDVRFPGIDVLINNASLFPENDGFRQFDLDQWDRIFNANLYGPFVLSRRLFSDHAKYARDGAIINLLDAGLSHPHPESFVYRLTKSALKEMTSLLALELAPHVRVNGVAPGSILPPARSNAAGQTVRPSEDRAWQLFDAHVKRDVPLKRPGSPEIIAANVIHLLEQDFLTGVILPVDGGEFI